MVVLVHLLQDTERTIIPYLNKEETLEGFLNDGYSKWKNKLNEKKKPLTKTQYHENFTKILSFIAQPIIATLLCAVVIYSIF